MGEQNERRVIGYDAGTGGDGGPVYERGGAGGLPEGVTWEPAHGGALALRVGLYVLAIAQPDGRWSAVGSLIDLNVGGTATPLPHETRLQAAQRAAVAALWSRDGYGVGEVRGALFRMVERAFRAEVLKIGAVKIPGLPGLWSVTATRPVPDGTEVDAVRVDARPAGEHADGCSYFFADAGDAESLCDCRRKPIATPESEGTGASDVDHPLATRPRRDDAVRLVREPFVPSARAAAETVEEMRRVGEGRELDRLLPALPGAIRFAREAFRNDGAEGETVHLLARTAELLTQERERAHDILRPHHAPTRDSGDMLATLARIVAERASLRDDRAAALRNVNAKNIELTDALGKAEEERDALRVRVAELEAERARPDFAADALALTLAAEQSIRNWLRAHGHDLSRPWDEVVIGLLATPPVGSVAEVLAKIEARESEERDKGTNYRRGDPDGDTFDAIADAFDEAADILRSALATSAVTTDDPRVASLLDGIEAARLRMQARSQALPDRERGKSWACGCENTYRDCDRVIRATFGSPSPMGKVVAEVMALNQRPHPDSEATPDDYLDHVGTLAEDGLPLDSPWEDIETVRDRLKWGAAMCIAGVLACDAKGGA